jgi:uncharacterized membrane protein
MDSLSAFRNTYVGLDEPAGFRLSRTSGWTSLGVGLAELAAPHAVSSLMGLGDKTTTALAVRAAGVGDVALGLAALLRPRRPAPLWARVAADVAGFAFLAWSLRGKQRPVRGGAALALSAGVMALDLYASYQVTRAQEKAAPPVMFSVTINRPPEEVYAFFRQLENLPRFMNWLESVEQHGRRSHWVARLPVGGTVRWDAEVVHDVPGERLAWHTVGISLFAHRGNVTFATRPGGEGTEVRVQLELGIPGATPSATLAKLLTKAQIKGDLRRLKQVLETGEVLFSDASSHRGPHPSQPSPEAAAHARARATESRLATEEGLS